MSNSFVLPTGVRSFDVPGGSVYYYGSQWAVSISVTIDEGPQPPPPMTAGETAILAAIAELKQEIQTMSASISSQLDALTAKFQTDIDGITASQADLHTQITTLTGELTVGTPVTQAQIDKLAAIEAAAAALAAPVVVTPPVTPPATPAA
jgi:hypothetical protein